MLFSTALAETKTPEVDLESSFHNGIIIGQYLKCHVIFETDVSKLENFYLNLFNSKNLDLQNVMKLGERVGLLEVKRELVLCGKLRQRSA